MSTRSNWEDSFRRGITAYRNSQFKEAEAHFTEAIANGGQQYNVYDSRAAVFEKLGDIREALRDSRKVIDMAPEMRQGYFRAARLLFGLKKYDAADQIIQLGLEALPSAKRTALESLREEIRLAKYSNRPSPFSKLPVEIVLQIFNDVVEYDVLYPIILSFVSSQWRSFVLSKPLYWETLVLSNRDPVHKTEKWIERSKHRIRNLVLRRNIPPKLLNVCLRKLGVTLFKTMRRFHSEPPLGLVFGQFLQSDKAELVVEPLPYIDLEEIRLLRSGPNYALDEDSKFTQSIISSSEKPLLHTLTVEHRNLDWSTIFPKVTSLRKLDLKWTNLCTNFIDILKTNPQLTTLAVDGNFSLTETPNIPASIHTVQMLYLTQLELRGHIEITRFISVVSFPALQQLEFSGIPSNLDNVFAHFHPMPTGLTHLHVRNCLFNTEPILTLISKLSKLQALTISHHGDGINSIVDLLAELTEFPHLSQVDFSQSSALTGGPLVRLVKSRFMAEPGVQAAKIRSIIINGCPRVDASVPEWLKQRVEKTSIVSLDMRYYEQKYPEVDDLVMVQVRQIAEMGAYVKLLEYDNIEGMILLSELSRRRIRSIQKLIRVGRNEVVVVLRVDKEKGYIDLSKRRVSPEDITKCEERFTKSKTVASIMRHVASRTSGVQSGSGENEAETPEDVAPETEEERLESLYDSIAWPLGKKYGHPYDAFKLALTESDRIFGDLPNPVPEGTLHFLQATIARRLTPQPIKLRADIELTCYQPTGIDAIKKALKAGEQVSTDAVPIRAKLVAPPLYVLGTNATDKYAAVERLERAIEVIQSTIEEQGGELVVKMKPKAVSDTDEQDLAQLMARAGQENAEVSGDEEEEEEGL